MSVLYLANEIFYGMRKRSSTRTGRLTDDVRDARRAIQLTL